MPTKKSERGRPPKKPGSGLAKLMQIRLMESEKQGFTEAASLCGQELSVWVRDVLRRAAQAKLQENGKVAPFLT